MVKPGLIAFECATQATDQDVPLTAIAMAESEQYVVSFNTALCEYSWSILANSPYQVLNLGGKD